MSSPVRTLGLRGARVAAVLTLVLLVLLVIAVPVAGAQEGEISPPPPLEWPVQAGPTASSDFSITVLRQLIELGANEQLCKVLMTEAGQPIPANFTWSQCPPAFQAKVTASEGTVSWAPGAKPTECGTNCVGRPLMTQSSALDRPSTIFAMLYGHLDFAIDIPGPINRDVRFGYEAQFRCLTEPGAREGDFNIRLVFGAPVVSEPGILESIADFLIPANLSRAIEAGIRSNLSTPGAQTQSLGRCTSIGVNKAEEPSFDSIRFDRPKSSAVRPTVRTLGAATALGSSATVRFLRITRKPPAFGTTPPAEPGQFIVFLNGIPASFPEAPALVLPAAGGSAEINYCKTIDLNGADRLQLIFANSHGGAVWSQFAGNTSYGAGAPRTMTTGRKVVVPGQSAPDPTTGKPGSTKPQSIVLREFELLYTIEYSARPDQVGVAPAVTGGGPGPAGAGVTGVRPGVKSALSATILAPGAAQPAQPCRKI